MSRERASTIAAAFLAASRAEIDALKPGNVHRFAAGHGMTAGTFLASAEASAPAIAAPGRTVGTRVIEATRASWEAVGVNANLGIVLLAAPLAVAAEQATARADDASTPLDETVLRTALRATLAGLGPADARDAFAAIALAAPGGLGDRAEHDVRRPPAIGLVEAMELAAGTDMIARQYASGFAAIFDTGLPALRKAEAAADRAERERAGLGPAFAVFLAFAAGFPDSHVMRKFGAGRADALRERFAVFAGEHAGRPTTGAAQKYALAFDDRLKAEGLNPGTSADLTVTTLFAAGLAQAASTRD